MSEYCDASDRPMPSTTRYRPRPVLHPEMSISEREVSSSARKRDAERPHLAVARTMAASHRNQRDNDGCSERATGDDVGTFEIGYAKPPAETRWKKGQSGNPRGRPKGRRGMKQIVQKEAQRKVTVTENGRRRSLPASDVVIRKVFSQALAGEQAAAKLVLSYLEKFLPDEVPVETKRLTPDDEKLLREFLTGVAVDTPEPADGT